MARMGEVETRGCVTNLVLRWGILAVAIALTAALLPGVEISGGFRSLVWITVLFSIVNAVLGPLARLLSLPLLVLTFGLFALVVNAALLAVTAWLSDDLAVDGFFTAVVAAAIISLVSALLASVFDRGQR